MGRHRAEDTPTGQSTSERNGGPRHDTGREPRHRAQETTPLTDRPNGATGTGGTR